MSQAPHFWAVFPLFVCEFASSCLHWSSPSCSYLIINIKSNQLIFSALCLETAFGSVQFSHSVMSNFLQLYGMQHARPLHHQLLELTQTHVHWVIPSNHLILCHSLLHPPSVFPSIRVFSNESVLQIRWPKYWSFSISPSSEFSVLISFRIDWFDLLAVQGTLMSLLKPHIWKESILQCSAFYMVQLLHPYMTTEKTTALTIWTFVSKVMSLLFNMLSQLVITFLPRSKHF